MFEGANIRRNKNMSGIWAGKIIAPGATCSGHGRDMFRVRTQRVPGTSATRCVRKHKTSHGTSIQTAFPVPVANLRQQHLFLAGGGRCGGSSRLGLLTAQLGEQAYKQENGKGNDEEIERNLQEVAVVKRHGGNFLPVHHLCRLQHQLQVCKIYSAHQQTDRRHNDIRHDGRYDFPERAADNHTDSHVNHVPFHGKRLKVLQE